MTAWVNKKKKNVNEKNKDMGFKVMKSTIINLTASIFNAINYGPIVVILYSQSDH